MEWAAEGEFLRQTSIRCYLFILRSEVRPVQLVDGHHDGHHVFTVHDGDGDDVLGLILSQLIHKVTEMRALWEEKKREYLIVDNCAVPLKTSSLNSDEHTTSIHKCCKQRLPIIRKNSSPSLLHSTYCSSCAAGVINCVPPGVKNRKSGSLTAKKEQKPAESDAWVTEVGDKVQIWVGQVGSLLRWYFLLQKEDWAENYKYSHMYILHAERR